MGMHRYHYVMMGIKTTKEEVMFDGYDERFLPYIEGHEGVSITIHMDDNSDALYIGHVLHQSDPWDDAEAKELEVPNKALIAVQINEVLELMPGSPYVNVSEVKLLAFTLVH